MNTQANDYATPALWLDPKTGIIARIEAARHRLNAHPARSVVLLPFGQLMPLAQTMWARAFGAGFSPRWATTLSWAGTLAPAAESPGSISFNAARDGLTARSLLERAGLAMHATVLAPRLVDAAHEVARAVAAIRPQDRAEWAATARAAVRFGVESGALEVEAAVARIALEWALASAHATDRIWQALEGPGAIDALIVLDGLSTDPLAEALKAHLGERAESVAMPVPANAATDRAVASLHTAHDTEEEAECAAACVLRHLRAGRAPVALAAVDRELTRRVRAVLAARALSIRDESGWALSTTRAAAHVMGALRATAWNASADAVLDWIKNSPAFAPRDVRGLEAALRRNGSSRWQSWCTSCAAAGPNEFRDRALLALTDRAEQLRARLAPQRTLVQWIAALRALLIETGQWERLAADAAGDQVLQTLQLAPDAQAAYAASLAATDWADRRIEQADFLVWVDAALEDARFAADVADDAQVVILPLAQLYTRPFAALVLPGCDEKRLLASPEPGPAWSAAQRKALGLATREQLAQAQAAAWACSLAVPQVDLLWRANDEGGEPLSPSPLLQRLLHAGGAATADDPREQRSVAALPTRPSRPRAPALDVTRISASAYESLRTCPYQFFALRQLGLQQQDEIDLEAGKREFGSWLHRVLKLFHDDLKVPAALVRRSRTAVMDEAAQQATSELGLADDEFLPFAAAWPRVRDGYLAWLDQHAGSGATFEVGEAAREQRFGVLTLVGRIDRIDRAADGSALLIDYKTESAEATRRRIKNAREDTQLAFYGALLSDDTFLASYLNVGEKETTRHEQENVVDLRDALVEGITSDMARIAAGAPLPPLGEGTACDWCAARGLCRKDFWT